MSNKRPPKPPAFQHTILELIWDAKDLRLASQVARDRVLEQFTLRNLIQVWIYRIKLKWYDKFYGSKSIK